MSYHVLIVDDSATTRAVVKRSLGMSGLEVSQISEARDGREALQRLSELQVDLVFADLNMPEMGGDELIQQMHGREELRHIPVVVISTEGSRTRLDRLQQNGVVGFLRKPFTPEQFAHTVQSLLTAPSAST